METKYFSSENLKQAIISIFVGAIIAFLTSMLEGLTDFLRDGKAEMVAGGFTSFIYLIRRMRI